MSQRAENRNTVANIVFDMESDVRDLQRWGDVVFAIGTGDGLVKEQSLCVVGNVIAEIGRRVEEQWEQLFALTRGEKREAQP